MLWILENLEQGFSSVFHSADMYRRVKSFHRTSLSQPPTYRSQMFHSVHYWKPVSPLTTIWWLLFSVFTALLGNTHPLVFWFIKGKFWNSAGIQLHIPTGPPDEKGLEADEQSSTTTLWVSQKERSGATQVSASAPLGSADRLMSSI